MLGFPPPEVGGGVFPAPENAAFFLSKEMGGVIAGNSVAHLIRYGIFRL